MTTIAYKNGIMACDGRATNQHGHIVDSGSQKIIRLKNGDLLGAAGDAADLHKLASFWNSTDSDERFPYIDATTAAILVSRKSGLITYMNSSGPSSLDTDYHSIGSGSAFALSAMDLGKSAIEAVRFATTRDIFSGGKISHFKFSKTKA